MTDASADGVAAGEGVAVGVAVDDAVGVAVALGESPELAPGAGDPLHPTRMVAEIAASMNQRHDEKRPNIMTLTIVACGATEVRTGVTHNRPSVPPSKQQQTLLHAVQ